MDAFWVNPCESHEMTGVSLLSICKFLFRYYLTIDEETQIHNQFEGNVWRTDCQVLWSGIPRKTAQEWADKRDMQTLTTAMGPLMKPESPLCLKRQKSSKEWSKYMKGASAVFACHISCGRKTIVLSPPPPARFHPSGMSTFQRIEAPILAGGEVLRIEMVHPCVKGAENFSYQIWPEDETYIWISKFGMQPLEKQVWRAISMTIHRSKHEEAAKMVKRATSSRAAFTNLTQGSEEYMVTTSKMEKAGKVQSVRYISVTLKYKVS